jgi:3-oxoacyl-[acyl-carrier-protein] synthase III
MLSWPSASAKPASGSKAFQEFESAVGHRPGSLFGLALAMRMAEAHGDVLVVASEKMSPLIETDPNTAILFGDGAGAALVSARPGRWRLLDAVLHTDGKYRGDLAFYPATAVSQY